MQSINGEPATQYTTLTTASRNVNETFSPHVDPDVASIFSSLQKKICDDIYADDVPASVSASTLVGNDDSGNVNSHHRNHDVDKSEAKQVQDMLYNWKATEEEGSAPFLCTSLERLHLLGLYLLVCFLYIMCSQHFCSQLSESKGSIRAEAHTRWCPLNSSPEIS